MAIGVVIDVPWMRHRRGRLAGAAATGLVAHSGQCGQAYLTAGPRLIRERAAATLAGAV